MVRQLKVLVLLLIVSNIGLGIFSFYLLRKIDRDYSELIGRSVPLLNDLQTLTALSAQAMRTTGPSLLDAPAERRAAAMQQTQAMLAREQRFRTHVFAREWLTPSPEGKPACVKAGDAFAAAAAEVVRLFAAGDTAGAGRLREEKLRPAFDDYQNALTHAADVLEAESLRTNDTFSTKTGSMSTVVLGLSGWPVILLVGLLVLTVLFVLVLMLLFRGSGIHDAP
jgi:hypothetical protein